MKEHYFIFLTIESSISRDGFVVVCICFIFIFEHYMYFILLQQLIVESGYVILQSVTFSLQSISTTRIATSSLYKSSTINSRVR